jgi:hypothetical protein
VYERKRSWHSLRHCSGICPKILGKTMKLCQDSRFSGHDLNPGPPEHEVTKPPVQDIRRKGEMTRITKNKKGKIKINV